MKNKTNKIVKYEDHAEIIIRNRQGNEKCRAIIDLDDIKKVKDYNWCENGAGYIISNKTQSHPKLYLHRFIIDYSDEKFIDHIDGNTMNNRKSNLRIVNPQQNMMNRRAVKPTKSGVVGVNYVRKTNKWKAVIMINRKTIFLGYYNDLEEAIEVRKQAEIDYFGEYRNKEDEED